MNGPFLMSVWTRVGDGIAEGTRCWPGPAAPCTGSSPCRIPVMSASHSATVCSCCSAHRPLVEPGRHRPRPRSPGCRRGGRRRPCPSCRTASVERRDTRSVSPFHRPRVSSRRRRRRAALRRDAGGEARGWRSSSKLTLVSVVNRPSVSRRVDLRRGAPARSAASARRIRAADQTDPADGRWRAACRIRRCGRSRLLPAVCWHWKQNISGKGHIPPYSGVPSLTGRACICC